jgi:signal transduction histidine kinase
MESQQNVLPPTEGVGEIRELTSAFASMIEDLQISKENLVRAAKLAVVGEMAAIMAHEVRTPLGILRSSAQMLKREPSLTDEGRELLSFLLSETERLNKLISTLLDCARPRPPMLRAVHLHPIIQRIIDMVTPQATRKNIRIVCELGAAPDELVCDEEQLVQVFLNLLINPIQILPVGGEITVRTFSNAQGLVVEIDDDGPGIPEGERQDVFHPFFTRREGGVGLGLTVVQQIVQTHSGDIRVETGPDGGARFRLFFPQSTDSNTVKGTS